jgi:DNA repair exonuclease SbcCD nuclease subunit
MDVHIWAKPFDPLREHDSPLDGQEFVPQEGINILMLHGAFIEGARRPLDALPYQMQQHPVFEEDIPEGVDYVALGHIHKPTIHELENGTIVGNPGSIETLDRTEQEFPNGFIVARLGAKPHVDFQELKTRSTAVHSFQVTTDMEDGTAAILHFLEQIRDEELVLWLDIEGTLTEEQFRTLDMRKIYEAANELFFAYTIKREIEYAPYGIRIGRRIATPVEAFTDFVQRRIEEVPESSRQIHKDALRKGLKYLEDEG